MTNSDLDFLNRLLKAEELTFKNGDRAHTLIANMVAEQKELRSALNDAPPQEPASRTAADRFYRIFARVAWNQ